MRTYYDIYTIGSPEFATEISMLVTSLERFNCHDVGDAPAHLRDPFLVVAELDFTAEAQGLQKSVRAVQEIVSTLAHKIAYVVGPAVPTQAHLLVCAEIGTSATLFGPERHQDLRKELMRLCAGFESQDVLVQIERDIEVAKLCGNRDALRRVGQRLQGLPKKSDAALTLLVAVYQALDEAHRTESTLRLILAQNPMNLWAANQLGKLYIRSRRVKEGIEILEKISVYQELNSERLLELGNAYSDAGIAVKAQVAFSKGDTLWGGSDGRFRDGMAKVRLLEGDFPAALAIFGDQGLSREVLSFLNTRAVMAVRNGRVADAMALYDQAIAGSRRDRLISAKLHFNRGLALIRHDDVQRAAEDFEFSRRLGGEEFARAVRPLALARTLLSKRGHGAALGTPTASSSTRHLPEDGAAAISRAPAAGGGHVGEGAPGRAVAAAQAPTSHQEAVADASDLMSYDFLDINDDDSHGPRT